MRGTFDIPIGSASIRPMVKVLQTSEEPFPAQLRAPTVYSLPSLSNPVIIHLSGVADAFMVHACVPLMIPTLYDSARQYGLGITVTPIDALDSWAIFIDTGAKI